MRWGDRSSMNFFVLFWRYGNCLTFPCSEVVGSYGSPGRALTLEPATITVTSEGRYLDRRRSERPRRCYRAHKPCYCVDVHWRGGICMTRNTKGRNITLRLNDTTVRKARIAASAHDSSLSKWVTHLIERELASLSVRERSWDRMAALMKRGFDLGGAPLTREEAHER